MPGESPNAASTANRWEGTHTYKKPEANKRKARTVAQLREEAAANSRANRDKAVNNRRGSLGEKNPTNSRRSSLPPTLRANTPARAPGAKKTINQAGASPTSDQEEVFFDADEMPGSNKKKRQASGAAENRADPSMDGPTSAMEVNEGGPVGGVDPAMLALLMSIKKDINETTTSAVAKVSDRIDSNARAIKEVGENTSEEIRKLRQHVDDSQAKFEEKMSRELEDRDRNIMRRITALENAKGPATLSPPSKSTPRQQEAYARARRSIKMWPIKGADLEDAVRVFMGTRLGIDDERIRTLGPITVKSSVGRGAKERSEALVQFDCREDRDFVKSMGFNLASDKGAGMAVHVPGHLLDNFYALNSIGYNIRQNQEGVRRAVKFDDSIQNIYLDICIGGNWKRIFPDQARTALKANPGMSASSEDRSIGADDLASLVRGDPVPGLTAVVVPEEDNISDQ